MAGTDKNLASGTQFGQYQIARLIGSGGMGGVYEARHMQLKKRVALKAMYPQYAARAEMVTRFMREGEAAARIRHPHVVDVSDVGVFEGLPYLVMEFLEGEDLRAMLVRDGAISASKAVALVIPVLSALHAAHEAGVVHRDLKPENIFLARGRNGETVPKVLDFGISKLIDLAADAAITRTTAIMGTPYYMSPEQTSSGKNVDARTDQYSLGVVLYETVTGVMPFEAPSLFDLMQAIVKGNATPPSRVRVGLPPGFDGVILRAMDRDPSRRFASLGDMARALLVYADDRTRAVWSDEFGSPDAISAPPPTMPPPASLRPESPDVAPVLQTIIGTSVPPKPVSSPTNATMIDDPSLELSIAGLVGSRTGRARWPLAVGSLAVLSVALWFAFHFSPASAPVVAAHVETPRPPPPAPTYRVAITVSPPLAPIELDGVAVATGSFVRMLPRDGTGHSLRISAPGFETQTVTFQDQSPPSSVMLVPLSAAITNVPPPPIAHVITHPAAVNSGPHTAPTNHTAHTTATAPTSHPTSASNNANNGTNGAPILN